MCCCSTSLDGWRSPNRHPKTNPGYPNPEHSGGLFITIEGIEGSGKTTLARLIGEYLTKAGRKVVITAEPGGSAVGDAVREIVLHCEEAMSDRAELLLFEAARAQHVDTVIRPALEAGSVLICDRFTDSSLAYQGYARGLDLGEVASLNTYATSGLVPDIAILLDLPAEAGLARQRKIDRISSRDIAFHESVRQGFLALAQSEPDRFVVIDATQDIDSVLNEALTGIGHFLVPGS